jgi:hypothetical protein
MGFNNMPSIIHFQSIVTDIKKPAPKTPIPGMLIGFDQKVALYHTLSEEHVLKLSQSMSMRAPVMVTINNITGEITAVEMVTESMRHHSPSS